MITQDLEVNVVPNKVICNFGEGDIGIGVSRCEDEKNKVSITISALKEKQEIGEPNDCDSEPVIEMNFSEIESLNVLKVMVEKAIKILTESKPKQETNVKKFKVPIKNIKLPEQILSDIVLEDVSMMEINEKMELVKGFSFWCINTQKNVEKVNVSAPNGIAVDLYGKEYIFKSDKIGILYEEINGMYILTLDDGVSKYNFQTRTLDIKMVLDIIKKIDETFDAKFEIVGDKTVLDSLAIEIKKSGMTYEYDNAE